MLKEDLFNSIASSYCNQLKLEQIDSDSYAISLPYRNYDGDLIEIGINIKALINTYIAQTKCRHNVHTTVGAHYGT